MAKRPTYTKEFKDRAVRLTLESDKPIEVLASELNVSAASLTKWRREQGVSSPRGGHGEIHALRKEVDELRRQNRLLEKEKRLAEMEREILKNRPRPLGPYQFTRNTFGRTMQSGRRHWPSAFWRKDPVKKPGRGDFGFNIGGA